MLDGTFACLQGSSSRHAYKLRLFAKRTPFGLSIRPFVTIFCRFKEEQGVLVAFGISFYKDIAGYPAPHSSQNLNCFDIIQFYPGETERTK